MSRQCCCKSKKPQCCCMQPQPSCCIPVQPSCCMPAQPSCCMPAQPSCCMPMESSCENKSACSFPCLIILILILLQFGRGRKGPVCCDPCDEPCEGNRFGGFGLDSGILFIIALYYLSCACPCG